MLAQPRPLKRAAKSQQQRDLDPLITRAEIVVRAAFDQARAEVVPVLAAFAQAYQAEYDRLNKDLEDDEEPKPVSHAWLVSSGWQKHVTDALGHAADKAASTCERAVIASHDQAARLGAAHGKQLVKQAMQPVVDAVVKAGAHRRVKRRKHTR